MLGFGLKFRQLESQRRVSVRRTVRGPRAWLWLVLYTVCGSSSAAYAHSAPGVAGILDETSDGVQMLRLIQGLVQKEGGSWRFVCSSTYGGAGQDLAASLPGGGVAIAVPTGIALVKRDGTIGPHPDPEAQAGTLTAFARSDTKLYALRMRPRQLVTDVIEVTDTAVRVLWTDTRFWSDIAVGTASLALVSFEQDQIEELRLSFTGEVISEQKGMLVDPLAVNVRVVGDVPYYIAKLMTSTVMGRIQDGMWQQVLMAGNALAGPLEMPDGSVLVALDGVLSTLADGVATPLTEPDFITGLYTLDGHPYACTRTGMRDLTSSGLGNQLFDMSELVGPDECLVADAARNDCELEWQHLQVELLGANIPLAAGDTTEKMCSMAGAAAGAIAPAPGAAGVGGTPNAPQSAGSAGSAGSDSPAAAGSGSVALPALAQSTAAGAGAAATTQNQPAGAGCSCGIVPRMQRRAASIETVLLITLGLLVRVGRRCRRRA